MKRLSLEEWENIFRNLQEMDESDYYDGVADWVEIMWLDGTDEYVLCYGEELFEDGFKTEKEAQERLDYLEQTLLSTNEAQKGDVIAVEDCGETIIGVVVDRYYEGGIEDNGVQYLTQDNELFCAFDGCYEIIGQVKIMK